MSLLCSCLFVLNAKSKGHFCPGSLSTTSFILNIFLPVLVSSSHVSVLHLWGLPLSNSWKKPQPDLGARLWLSLTPYSTLSEIQELPIFWQLLKLDILLPKCDDSKKGNGYRGKIAWTVTQKSRLIKINGFSDRFLFVIFPFSLCLIKFEGG